MGLRRADETGFLDPDSGQFSVIASAIGAANIVGAPRTSWGDKWLTFYSPTPAGTTTTWIVSVTGKDPIPLNHGSTWDVNPEFSPDGSRIYYLSQRDGTRCLWVQKLDAARRPRRQARTRPPLPQRPPLAHL